MIDLVRALRPGGTSNFTGGRCDESPSEGSSFTSGRCYESAGENAVATGLISALAITLAG